MSRITRKSLAVIVKMRKPIVIIVFVAVVACISWQMSSMVFAGFRNTHFDSGSPANTSRRVKTKHSLKHNAYCVGVSCDQHFKHGGHSHQGLTMDENQFYLDGKPFRILGGSFHYFRTQPHQWIDRLERMKAAGLNTVTTYIPWNLHEKVRGQYNFAGKWKLFTFIKLVWKMGLLMIVRPGPFICAEWELGGLPSWLLHDPNMAMRTSRYQPYLHNVELYFDQLLPQLAKYGYKNGGPIIAFQVENEFGNFEYGRDNKYMEFLVGLFRKHGIKELLLTSDNGYKPDVVAKGSVNGLLMTINLSKDPRQPLEALKKLQPNKPLMVMEFWPGWLDSWGEKHSTMSVVNFIKAVDVVLSMNASINFYMFVGGTNFGFWNGAALERRDERHFTYLPTTTSYDYDALVSESGDCHPTKYKALRLLLLKHRLVQTSLPAIPAKPLKDAYGTVKMTEYLKMDDFFGTLRHKPITLPAPIFMEYLNISNHGGQAFGWILYRTSFDFGNSLLIQGFVHNRAHIFINNEPVKIIFNTLMKNLSENVLIEMKHLQNKDNILEILVENMGRVNGWKLDEQRRGFQGTVTINGKVLSPWEHVSLDFSDGFFGRSTHWKSYAPQRYPSLYRGYFTIHRLHDTFLYMGQWTKGIAIINGYNVGRYWNIGPQKTLYIPRPLLRKGKNEVVIFELENPADKVEFIGEAVLNNATRTV